MHRVWLILNKASRAVGEDWEATLVAAFEARGCEVAGTTDFPDGDLPSVEQLKGIDTVAVAAGDGTINATATALDDWDGMLLVLPGGTMNLLAKALHDGSTDPQAIIAAVADPPNTRSVPTVDSDDVRAYVGAIVGPAASWVHAREAVRKSAWGKLRRAVRLAYLRSLSHSVRLVAGKRRSRGYRAIFIHPDGDTLSLVKIRADGWQDGVRLGFGYLTGSWENARGVETARTTSVTLAEDTPTFALFDGEPLRLPPAATLSLGTTKLRFITTP